MSEVIGQYQQGAFTTPVNGGDLDATAVLGNDNNTRTKHNSHDSDAGIHFQSSVLASRPAFGTAGRKWMTSDGLRIYYDTGAAWSEAEYLNRNGERAMTGPLLAADGDASAPGLSFDSDPDTGFYKLATGFIHVAANGALVAALGVAGGQEFLQVGTSGGASLPSFGFIGDTSTGMFNQAADTIGFSLGGTEGMRIEVPASGFSALRVLRDGGGGASLEQVSLGAADSGGAGFKVLRVPN